MLAPRKSLWSTPLSAVDHLERWILPSLLQADDDDDAKIERKWIDIGCGDGRIVLEWAQRISWQQERIPKIQLIGIDIDPERIQTCQKRLEELHTQHKIHELVEVTFVCANALECEDLLKGATAVFLYLIPRGLKMILPMLHNCQPRHVVSYMAKLPGETVREKALLTNPHQPGAEWPLYYYNWS